jgi:hypothetical protein
MSWIMSSSTASCAGLTGKERRNPMDLKPIFYVVEQLDGDYAQLRRVDNRDAPLKPVARALLPAGINEGSKLKYEMFQYELID